jgi:hypothetical protein
MPNHSKQDTNNIIKGKIMKLSNKLTKVEESLTVYRYDNGFMVEISGRDSEDDWITSKILATSLDEVFELITAANNLPKT